MEATLDQIFKQKGSIPLEKPKKNPNISKTPSKQVEIDGKKVSLKEKRKEKEFRDFSPSEENLWDDTTTMESKITPKPKSKLVNKYKGSILIGIKRKRDELEDPIYEITLGYNKNGKVTYKRVVTESEQMLHDFNNLDLDKKQQENNCENSEKESKSPNHLEKHQVKNAKQQVLIINQNSPINESSSSNLDKCDKSSKNKKENECTTSKSSLKVKEDDKEDNSVKKKILSEKEEDSNEELSDTIKILTEFYDSIKDENKPKVIKLKRISRQDKLLLKEISVIKNRVKELKTQQQIERKAIKEKRFMKNRNIGQIKKEKDNKWVFIYELEFSQSIPNFDKKKDSKTWKFVPNIIGALVKNNEESKEEDSSKFLNHMGNKNHNVHYVTIGNKSFTSRLSSDDDDEYEYYQITDENTDQTPNPIQNLDNSFNNINEEENCGYHSYDSDDSNRPDQEHYEYGDADDDDLEGRFDEYSNNFIDFEYTERPSKAQLAIGMKEGDWDDEWVSEKEIQDYF